MNSTQDARSGKQVYNRIPVLRAERGLRRQDLATRLDVSYQTIGYLERGEFNPSLELVFRICEFFDLPMEAIFSRAPFGPMSDDLYARRPVEPATVAEPRTADRKGK